MLHRPSRAGHRSIQPPPRPLLQHTASAAARLPAAPALRGPAFVSNYFSQTNLMTLMQEILDKFEFFPVKCRVQRAQEIAQLEQEKKKTSSSPRLNFRTKA